MFPAPENLVACLGCDLLQRIPPLPPGGRARCARCGEILAVHKPDSLDRTLGLAVAAAIVFIVANVMTLMELSAVGREASTTVIGGAQEMWAQGEKITALLVAFCVVIAPAIQIGFMLAVLLAARRPPAPSWTGTLLRWSKFSQPWSMIEVMMLGILVALVKIASLATVIPGVGMFAVGALVVLLAAMTANFDAREVWLRVRWVNGKGPQQEVSPKAGGSREARG